MSQYIDGEALLRVLLLSLVFGAGVPAVFAFGVRALAAPAGADGSPTRPGAGRRAVAMLCFAICVAAVVVGVAKLVIGND